MTLKLTAKDYAMNEAVLRDCFQGQMCKILRIADKTTGETLHMFCTDITQGWAQDDGEHLYHFTRLEGTCNVCGLGVFLLIRKLDGDEDGCTLEFTDDLNPELP